MLRAHDFQEIPRTINIEPYTSYRMGSEFEELKQAVALLQKQVGRLSGTSSISGRGRIQG
jgi:hypothetical protein